MTNDFKTDKEFLSDDRFQYPDMGDFYINAVNSAYYKRLQKLIEDGEAPEFGELPGEGGDPESEEAASFYHDPPPVTQLGSHDDMGVYFVKAHGVRITDEDINMGYMDGDTVRVDKDSIDPGDSHTKAMVIDQHGSTLEALGLNSGSISFRFLGLDAPEVDHWKEILGKNAEENLVHKTFRYEDIKHKKNEFIIIRSEERNNNPDQKIRCIKLNKSDYQWRESEVDSIGRRIYLIKAGEESQIKRSEAIRVSQEMKKLFDRANNEVYFLIDRTSLNARNAKYPSIYKGLDIAVHGQIKKDLAVAVSQALSYQKYKYAGFNEFGQDMGGTNARWLAAPYVKVDGQWINVSKYIIAQSSEVEVLKDYTDTPSGETNRGYAARAFDLHSYDYKNRVVYDIHTAQRNAMDDRRRVQRKIFNQDFDDLRDWTVSIGDTTLFVPPTSIRYSQQQTQERIPVMRSKGSMVKGSPKTKKTLEMTIYFNEERGINGYPFEDTLPSGDKILYSMNGLRALVSQFKFTPFLPIESTYVNEILGIDAVSLVNIQVITNQNFPRLLTCVLTVQEFDFSQYMPELPLDIGREGKYYNPFASTFNFELMRWYYQRPLIRGDKAYGLSINSQEYNDILEGGRTVLAPMAFNDSKFSIYAANEEHVARMYQAKIARDMRNQSSHNVVGDKEAKEAKRLRGIFEGYKNISSSNDIEKDLDTIDSSIRDTDYKGIIEFSPRAVKRNDSSDPYKITSISGNTGIKKDSFHKMISAVNSLRQKTITEMTKASEREVLVRFDRDELYATKGEVRYKVVFSLTQSMIDEIAYENLINGAELGLNEKLSEDLKNGEFSIEYASPLTTENNKRVPSRKFSFDHDKDAHFFSYLENISNRHDETGSASVDDEIEDLKEALDKGILDHLQYDKIAIDEDTKIMNLGVVYGNSFTSIGLNGNEGYANQYMGGQDTIVEATVRTSNMYTVGVLSGLPRAASYLLTNYRSVMPAAPIKFESELSKMFGVSEVLIEEVIVDSVPNYPGVYDVSLRMTSMDRTVRAKEGIEKINESAYGGSTSSDNVQSIKSKTYAELGERFGEAELYPDLELPKIKELNNSGFDFLRHKFDTTRVYPDPDFYFDYSHILQSEIFRESVISGEIDDLAAEWREGSGEAFVEKVDEDGKVINTGFNEAANNFNKACDIAESIDKRSSPDPIDEYIKNNMPVLNTLDSHATDQSWDISKKISVNLMEPTYAEMINLHKRGQTSENYDRKETKWVYDSLEELRGNIDKIREYLLTPIGDGYERNLRGDFSFIAHTVLRDSTIKEMFNLGNVDISKNSGVLAQVVHAAAVAATGKKEWKPKMGKKDYEPDPNYIGLKYNKQVDGDGIEEIVDPSDAGNAVEFGPFKMKMYTSSEISEITGKVPLKRKDAEKDNINSEYFLLDPYYREKASIEEIEEYKRKVVSHRQYAVVAFMRNALFWFVRMHDDLILPNINLDHMSDEFLEEIIEAENSLSKKGLSKEDKKNIDQLREQILDYYQFIKKGEDPISGGKFFVSVLLATVGPRNFYSMLKERDYAGLENAMGSISDLMSEYDEQNRESVLTRRFFNALVGLKVIDSFNDTDRKYSDTLQSHRRASLERKYIKYANDPNMFVKHSFYDMCVHDMRGRMARAFPSFYIMLVDEGRKIGYYKLNDNFYNLNSVSEIQVHKSRKIPADTCRIVVSNFFHTYTTDDDDKEIHYQYDPKDIFNSIFNPLPMYQREQAKRLTQQPLNKVKLTPGTRIHVRMGYGANADTLPIVFNGKITEVNAGEVVEMICQGDGVELTNPMLTEQDADEIKNNDKAGAFLYNLFNNTNTPKEILDGMLTSKGSFVKELMRKYSNNLIENINEFGITHFGDMRYKEIYKNGEVTQNIFEGTESPVWGNLKEDKGVFSKTAPKVSTEVFGKTPWDLANFTASVSPDFIVGVAPFGLRSTLFHGRPRFYYAFDYQTTENGNVYEKRKPYQQYHIVTSNSDIISNEITADASRIRTNAVGTFKSKSKAPLGGTKVYQTDRLYANFDIYPEHQKSMVYDTQVYDKGIPGDFFRLGKLAQWADGLLDYYGPNFLSIEDNGRKSVGIVQSGRVHATTATANGLRDSMRDMYTGELVLLGTPSLKPHDRIYMYDTYEDMSGQFTVESVVHSLSHDTGLTSSVTPDLISVIDDEYEKVTRTGINGTAAVAIIAYLTAVGLSFNGEKKTVKGLSHWISKFSSNRIKKLADGKIGSSKKVRGALEKIKNTAEDLGKKIKVKPGIGGKLVRGGAILAAGAVSLPAAGVAIGVIATELAVSTLIGGALNRKVAEFIKNSQVLQVFPLMKNGKVFTAGINGEVGMAYGSINYNKLGMIPKMLSTLSSESASNGIPQKVAAFFASGEVVSLAEEYARQGAGGDSTDEDVVFETSLMSYLKGMTSQESAKIHGYKKLMISPRIQNDDPDRKKKYSNMFILEAHFDSRLVETQSDIPKNNVLVEDNDAIREMMDYNFFGTIWDEDAEVGHDEEIEMLKFRAGGRYKEIKGLYKIRNGEKIYDLPFLKEEAISLLVQILVRTRANLPKFDTDIEVENEEFVLLTSALTVGGGMSNPNLAMMGYSFSLKSKDNKTLMKAVNEVKADFDHAYENNESINKEVFAVEERDGAVMISVFPPDKD